MRNFPKSVDFHEKVRILGKHRLEKKVLAFSACGRSYGYSQRIYGRNFAL
ncbi:Hypothetical protein Minf_1613 [Methylacidiphilum infernorum V4]|uniref:Uncharacterized protein n=1 Tax=Methylacidiphilum infernorum (isolate V4) TaxID=481448 RepID=B3DWG4_METI4|nr:Hypothetical protein Minf_1613 [Methylacidiphilum infernorum V4]